MIGMVDLIVERPDVAEEEMIMDNSKRASMLHLS